MNLLGDKAYGVNIEKQCNKRHSNMKRPAPFEMA